MERQKPKADEVGGLGRGSLREARPGEAFCARWAVSPAGEGRGFGEAVIWRPEERGGERAR
ncbi:MAG TPA: hypothetical protein ENH82_09590 [bacterium]|nr:hypothetical protein [bacterium]